MLMAIQPSANECKYFPWYYFKVNFKGKEVHPLAKMATKKMFMS